MSNLYGNPGYQYGPPGSQAQAPQGSAPPGAAHNMQQPGSFAPPGGQHPGFYQQPGSFQQPGVGFGGPPSSYQQPGPPNSFQPGGPPRMAPMGPPTMGGPPSIGGPPTMGGPPSMGGPPTMGGPPSLGGPAMGGPPIGVPPSSGPPRMGGPPAGSSMPPPKSSVQFFSVGGGGAAPVPSPTSSFGGMPPPPSAMGGPPSGGGYGPPAPGSGPGGFAPPGEGQQFQQPGQQFQQPGQQFPSYSGPPPGNYLSATAPQPMMGLPSGFDGPAYGQHPPGQPGIPGAPGAPAPPGADGVGGGQVLPGIEDMDLSIQCDPAFLRSSVGKIVSSQAYATKSRLPLGIMCRPMAGDVGIENDQVEVVDFGTTGIVRCKRCRTYINPFVSWVDNGRRWRCNICGMLNDVPTSYFSHLDQNGQRRDKDQRPELSCCSVEFVAPGDYMVRPPQPPVFFFVIDVTSGAGSSGMLQHTVNSIRDSLDSLPGNPRTHVGFITFDSSIHFYNLKSTLKAPQMLVVSDITDVIMPSPEDLLVNLFDSRNIVEALLDSLPAMFQNNNQMMSCTGPALNAAKRVIQNVGGKVMLFQTSLPSIGEGTLKPRENPRMLGTDKEHMLLNAEESWYKNTAIEFSRLQICIDVFLFSSQYTDVATFSVLSKYTAGSTYYYPGFYGPRDGDKFEAELGRALTRACAFEAVMRVRATRGLRIQNFYGSFFIRGTDLLALPNCHADSVYTMDFAYDEPTLSTTAVTVQAALLYTNSAGERRIRVHTMVIPVTQSLSEMLSLTDIDCAVNISAKQAVDTSLKGGLDASRTRVHQNCVEILRAAKSGVQQQQMPGQYGAPGYQQQAPASGGAGEVPVALQLLPLYSMSLQKNLALRGGADVRTDERAFFMSLVANMDIEESKVFIYPRMFSIHDMSMDAGTSSDNADDVPTAGSSRVRLPAILNLSHERLTTDGMFLLENGYDMFLWIGRNVNPAILDTLFGLSSLEHADMSQLKILSENSDFSNRFNAIVEALRDERTRYLQLHFIREGDGYAEAYFSRFLVEDRANFTGGTFSYVEYHSFVSRQVSGMPG